MSASALSATVLSAALPATHARAAEIFVQPMASLQAENDSNLDLDPGGASSVQGYQANAGTLIGIASPTADATLLPRINYQDYPKNNGNDRLEEYLTFRSDYRWTRSSASFNGTVDHRDDFNAELNNAVFDPINPENPTAPETGKAVVGLTRTSAYLQPRYDYRFSPTIGIGVSGIYQGIRYSPSNASFFVDFNYYLARAFLSWSYSPKTEFEFGGYGSRYDATQIDSTATGSAVTFDAHTNWTQLFSTSLSLVYQHLNANVSDPLPVATTSNDWGAVLSAVYAIQNTTQLRVNLGRYLTPSGGGGVYVNDQLQFQYNHDLTARFSFTGAAIVLRNHGISPGTVDYSRDYLQTVVEAKYKLSPTFFVQGGYQYGWQKYRDDPSSASNNKIYIRFVYQGLGRQY